MKLLDDDIDVIDAPSLERIASQAQDNNIARFQKQVDMLHDVSKHYQNKLNNGYAYHRFKHTKPIIAEMERILTGRFGIDFKLINMPNLLAAVIPTPPLNDNVLGENGELAYEEIAKMLNLPDCENGKCEHVKIPKDVKDYRDIRDVMLDEKSTMYQIWDSFNKMSKVLNTDGVTVNNKKATIEGLPKGYNVFILVDFDLCFNKYKITPRELVAIILHEVGHAYTYISQSYRTTQTTTVLMDTLKYELGKGTSFTSSMNVLYKKLDGKENMKDESGTNVMLKVMDLYMDKTKQLDMNNPYSFTDSEQVADNFATRFGYGSELVTGLDGVTYNNYNVINFLQQTTMVIFLQILLMTFNIMLAVTTAILAPIAIVVATMIYTRILDTVIPEKYRTETYDRLAMRYTRINLDVIRQLRTSDLPKDTISKYLKDYERIDKIINNTAKDKRLSEVLSSTFPWNKGGVRRKLGEQTMEKLMENKLHIQTHALREHI